jgi:hypothetical protein
MSIEQSKPGARGQPKDHPPASTNGQRGITPPSSVSTLHPGWTRLDPVTVTPEYMALYNMQEKICHLLRRAIEQQELMIATLKAEARVLRAMLGAEVCDGLPENPVWYL